jgi:hypothetical protein
MIKVQDHICHTSGMRDSSTVVDEVNALQEFDKLAIYMDYFIVQSFQGFKPYSFEQFKKNMYWNENIYGWYYFHFQIIKSKI